MYPGYANPPRQLAIRHNAARAVTSAYGIIASEWPTVKAHLQGESSRLPRAIGSGGAIPNAPLGLSFGARQEAGGHDHDGAYNQAPGKRFEPENSKEYSAAKWSRIRHHRQQLAVACEQWSRRFRIRRQDWMPKSSFRISRIFPFLKYHRLTPMSESMVTVICNLDVIPRAVFHLVTISIVPGWMLCGPAKLASRAYVRSNRAESPWPPRPHVDSPCCSCSP
jgi:hypothetical protein